MMIIKKYKYNFKSFSSLFGDGGNASHTSPPSFSFFLLILDISVQQFETIL
jgi:hypothetical protein